MNSLYMYSGEICVADVRKRREERLRKVMKSIEAKRDAANFSDPKALLLNTVLELQKICKESFYNLSTYGTTNTVCININKKFAMEQMKCLHRNIFTGVVSLRRTEENKLVCECCGLEVHDKDFSHKYELWKKTVKKHPGKFHHPVKKDGVTICKLCGEEIKHDLILYASEDMSENEKFVNDEIIRRTRKRIISS